MERNKTPVPELAAQSRSAIESRLTIAKAGRGSFELMDYTWKYDGIPQEGLLLVGYDEEQNAVTIAWADSWHMNKKIMHCVGAITADGEMSAIGSYEAPPGSDWSWRIAISAGVKDKLRIVMHNISPEGKSELAVEAEFVRER